MTAALVWAKAWLFYAELACWILTPALLIAGRPGWAVASLLTAITAFLAERWMSRRAPAPMPYTMRWVLRLPRFAHAPVRVVRSLRPYVVTVLGEVADPAAALRELHRVLKPGGRLLVAEEVLDPDFIPLPRLRRLARETGFAVGDVAGWRFSYRSLLSPAR